MRLVINILVAAMMLLSVLDAPCTAAPADHGHDSPGVVIVVATAHEHHRGDSRSVSGAHCQQDGIISQDSELLHSQPHSVSFVVASSVAFTGALEPVEQRPPIASV